ncbi:hypothetical protein [Deinococcus sp. UR1]|uniref:hypothetical protein n=1 Tax=Deinococcus sp. UR1 TaxID=1704277 RepID=UPI0006DD3651|nr:hypothetical protein [Deinococcus sp. UR1]PIG98325.1 hypothetical protein AMD26_009320 [Deinococcus sp. UR1]
MSKVLASTQLPDGTTLSFDAGFDPPLNIHFLDVYREGQEDPVFESLFHHPGGRFAYSIADLTADVTRLAGHPLPELTAAIIALGPVPNEVRDLGRL